MDKPEHYCADHDFARLFPGDARLETCKCTFTRDTQERHRERWQVLPAGVVPGDSGVRLGGATVGLDEYGAVSSVLIDEPPFEQTLVKDLIEQLPYIVEGFKTTGAKPPFRGSVMKRLLYFVVDTMNTRLEGLLLAKD